MAVNKSGGISWSEIRKWIDSNSAEPISLGSYQNRLVFDVNSQRATIMPSNTIKASQFLGKMKMPAAVPQAPTLTALRQPPASSSHFSNGSVSISFTFQLLFPLQNSKTLGYNVQNRGPIISLYRRLSNGGAWSVYNTNIRQPTLFLGDRLLGNGYVHTATATVTAGYDYRFSVSAQVLGPENVLDPDGDTEVKAESTLQSRIAVVTVRDLPAAPVVSVITRPPPDPVTRDTYIYEDNWQKNSVAVAKFDSSVSFEIPGYNDPVVGRPLYSYKSHRWVFEPRFLKNGAPVQKATLTGKSGSSAQYAFKRTFPASDVTIGPNDLKDTVAWKFYGTVTLYVDYRAPDGTTVTVQDSAITPTVEVNVDYHYKPKPPDTDPDPVYAQLASFTVTPSVVEGGSVTWVARFRNAAGKKFTIWPSNSGSRISGYPSDGPYGELGFGTSFERLLVVPSNGQISGTIDTKKSNIYHADSVSRSLNLQMVDVGERNPWENTSSIGASASFTILDAPETYEQRVNTGRVDEGGTFVLNTYGTNVRKQVLDWQTTFPASAISGDLSGSITQSTPSRDNDLYSGTISVSTAVRPTHYEDVTGRIKVFKSGVLKSQTGVLTIKNTHTAREPDPVPTAGTLNFSASLNDVVRAGLFRDFVCKVILNINENGTYNVTRVGTRGSGTSGVLTDPSPLGDNWITRVVPGSGQAGDFNQSIEDPYFARSPEDLRNYAPDGTFFPLFIAGSSKVECQVAGNRVRNKGATYFGTASWELYNKVTKQRIPGGSIRLGVDMLILTGDRGSAPSTPSTPTTPAVTPEPEPPKVAPPPTYSGEFCRANNLWAMKTVYNIDGSVKSTTRTLMMRNSPKCMITDGEGVPVNIGGPIDIPGVPPITIPPIIVPPIITPPPPAPPPPTYTVGAIVPGSEVCINTTKIWSVYITAAGATQVRSELNSPFCGYVPPPAPAPKPPPPTPTPTFPAVIDGEGVPINVGGPITIPGFGTVTIPPINIPTYVPPPPPPPAITTSQLSTVPQLGGFDFNFNIGTIDLGLTGIG